MLEYIIHSLDPITSCKVLKENPHTLQGACILAKRSLHLANLVSSGSTRRKFK